MSLAKAQILINDRGTERNLQFLVEDDDVEEFMRLMGIALKNLPEGQWGSASARHSKDWSPKSRLKLVVAEVEPVERLKS